MRKLIDKPADRTRSRAAKRQTAVGSGEAPLSPPRRRFICSMSAAAITVVTPAIARARQEPSIVIVDGWILADSDLR